MTKAFFVALLAVAGLTGGLFALQGSRRKKSPRSQDPSLLVRRYQRYTTSSDSRKSERTGIISRIRGALTIAHVTSSSARIHARHLVLASRVGAVLLAAVIFGTAAYLGIGQSLEASAGSQYAGASAGLISSATQEHNFASSLHDDLRADVSRFQAPAPAPALVTDTPAPTAAPVVEAAATAPDPTIEPAPAAVEAPAPTAVAVPQGAFEDIICSLPWPCAQAVAIARCESGTDRSGRLDGNWATNGANFGLFQINQIHAGRWADFWDNWMDPAKNAQWAYEIWSQSGWTPWSCRYVLG